MKIFLLVMIFLAFAGYARAGTVGESVYLKRGERLTAAGDYGGAARVYQQAANLYPSSAELMRRLGESYLKLGDNEAMTNLDMLEKAVLAFRGALAINPDMKEAHMELGRTYLAMQDRAGAIRERDILEELDKGMALRLSDAINAWKPPPAYTELGTSGEAEHGGTTEVSFEKNVVLAPVTIFAGTRSVRVVLVVDTGASITTINSDVAERLGVSLDGAPEGGIQVAGGGMIRARAIRVNRVEVGSHTKRNMIVAVIDNSGPREKFDGLLGMDFLRDQRFHVDYRNKVIIWDK